MNKKIDKLVKSIEDYAFSIIEQEPQRYQAILRICEHLRQSLEENI